MYDDTMYKCWLGHENLKNSPYKFYLKTVVIEENIDSNVSDKASVSNRLINSALKELSTALSICYGNDEESRLEIITDIYSVNKPFVLFRLKPSSTSEKRIEEGYSISKESINQYSCLCIESSSEKGILYGVFGLLRLLECGQPISETPISYVPAYSYRLINHWDNIDGTVERGYAGSSIFFEAKRNNHLTKRIMEAIGIPASSDLLREAFNDEYQIARNTERISDYARFLCSIGINCVVINNTNVHKEETLFIDSRMDMVKTISDILSVWGIQTFISINYAAPITLGELDTSDPLDPKVRKWWVDKVAKLYNQIPSLGGFMVKADSEGRPGPFTYGRNHADGANMLASALAPYGGILIWRCFVYNCQQDWRDRTIDRAKAAYDCFKPLDGDFLPNVFLQIKNGPMDFQVREPISPLFGAMPSTNKFMELQITQEYTGQQKHLCCLIPWWKQVLSHQITENETVSNRILGIAAVSNIGSDPNWTGHFLAQANLYGYGRLCWDPSLDSDQIIKEWVVMTFGTDSYVVDTITRLLKDSWPAYESYTAPLGVGWMVSPGHHYGPDVDGYEYSRWGTYHFADHMGIGVDRTIESGTGFTGQYYDSLKDIYNDISKCPDELLLFFHHVPYTHRLHSGKTVIQHIYDSHFDGYNKVLEFINAWSTLENRIPEQIYVHVMERLKLQQIDSKEWCDQVSTYFYRLSYIADEKGRITPL